MTNLPIPDMLTAELTQEAQTQGMSVEDLLTQMLRERQRKIQLHKRKYLTGEALTLQLNKFYAQEVSVVDPVLSKLQMLTLEHEKW